MPQDIYRNLLIAQSYLHQLCPSSKSEFAYLRSNFPALSPTSTIFSEVPNVLAYSTPFSTPTLARLERCCILSIGVGVNFGGAVFPSAR